MKYLGWYLPTLHTNQIEMINHIIHNLIRYNINSPRTILFIFLLFIVNIENLSR